MPIRPSIDDLNTTLVEYKGNWEELIGSSRQWESSVHATGQTGATATFKFRGYLLWIWGTIPAGVGRNMVEISIDGGAANSTSRASNGSAVYNELYFESTILRDTYHTVVVTNRGSTANGDTEFMLDRFEFEASEVIPLFTPPGSSPTSSTTSPPSSTYVPASSPEGSKTPAGAIAGAVVGALVLLALVLLFLLWRRKKRGKAASMDAEKPDRHIIHPRRSSLTPTPFQLSEVAATASQSSTNPLSPSQPYANEPPQVLNSFNSISEKSGYRNMQPGSTSPTTSQGISSPTTGALIGGLTSSTTLSTGPSQPTGPFSPISNDSRSMSTSNEAASSMYVPHSAQLQADHAHPSGASDIASSNGDAYDQPPPSYWHNTQATPIPPPNRG
ncbi:hypothetical protein B0H34DRAFT_702350 [Crassisporium funariophilum]|nr:hypothetical protein B0H34DRAFT_702350 [Crassisporium funariophilum]